jgi:hypothetical protein
LKIILSLTRELGVNLAGVEIILGMRDRMRAMQQEVQEFVKHLQREVMRRPHSSKMARHAHSRAHGFDPIGKSEGGSFMTNVLRTTVLLAALTALFLVIGGAIGGNQGLFIAFVFALLMNFASYWFSDKIVLSMYGAREVSLNEAPDLYRLVQRLARVPHSHAAIISFRARRQTFATGRNPQHGAWP